MRHYSLKRLLEAQMHGPSSVLGDTLLAVRPAMLDPKALGV